MFMAELCNIFNRVDFKTEIIEMLHVYLKNIHFLISHIRRHQKVHNDVLASTTKQKIIFSTGVFYVN